MSISTTTWEPVEEWWERYVEAQRADIDALHSLLKSFEERWKASPTIFDRDPLSIDWSPRVRQAGPMRFVEKNWSRWLAALLRDSDGPFLEALFGPPFATGSMMVRCERTYRDEELHDRRVDIVVKDGSVAASVEVKIGDDAYEKTLEAAYLAETNDPTRTWTHTLLLPAYKEDALLDAFEGRVRETDSRYILEPAKTTERPVEVYFWDEVSAALRAVLLEDHESSDHWRSGAFLLTALIEQRIVGCYPIPAVERVLTDRVALSDVIRLQAIDPEDQLEYLRRVEVRLDHG